MLSRQFITMWRIVHEFTKRCSKITRSRNTLKWNLCTSYCY